MDEMEKQVAEFFLKVFAKWLYRWLSDSLRERRTSFILLEIPHPSSPPKKPKKHAKKKARVRLPLASPRGKFCPECGQERP
jgi:hypothetical protein